MSKGPRPGKVNTSPPVPLMREESSAGAHSSGLLSGGPSFFIGKYADAYDTVNESYARLRRGSVDEEQATHFDSLLEPEVGNKTNLKLILEDGLVANGVPYKENYLKIIFFYISCVCSAGFVFLFSKWFPKFKVFCKYSITDQENATHFFITDSWGKNEIIRVENSLVHEEMVSIYNILARTYNQKHGRSELSRISIFNYRCLRFIYNPIEKQFVETTTWIETRPWKYILLGLDEKSVRQRRALFDENSIVVPEKSTAKLLIDEVLHPFYIFQMFSVILWCLETYYYYAVCIFIISVISTTTVLLETKKNLKRLRDMALFSCTVNVYRAGAWKFIHSKDLVPGDIMHLDNPTGVIPCDAILLSGDCIINESMLTGESIPVSKIPATKEEVQELQSKKEINSRSFLFCGTKIIRVRAPVVNNESPVLSAPVAIVVRTGFDTMKGGLLRSMMFPKPHDFQFYRDSFLFIGVLSGIAIIGFVFTLVNFLQRHVIWSRILVRALDLVTIVVPPALPAAMAIGTSYAIGRLKKKRIFCISPPRVNICGKINVMVFDKTGTLTEDGLDVLGLHSVDPSNTKFGHLMRNSETLVENIQSGNCFAELLDLIVTCHSLRMLHDELIGDPMDLKLFKFTDWDFEESPDQGGVIPTMVRSRTIPLRELGIIRCLEFESSIRRMSVIVKSISDNIFKGFTKGAPEVIREICLPQTIPSDFDEILHEYTNMGYRVLGCAYKTLDTNNWATSLKLPREKIESDLTFLGFLVFENKLKRETLPVLNVLNNANIRNIMCTGDNLLTAISVSRECGLISKDTRVFIPTLSSTEPFSISSTTVTWACVDYPQFTLDPIKLVPSGHGILSVNNRRSDSVSNAESSVSSHGVSPSLETFKLTKKKNYHSVPSMETAINIETSGMKQNNMDYVLAVTGDVFGTLIHHYSTETMRKMLIKGAIYARMSPDQKHELVEHLQGIEYCVGFCGDGANDCGALRAADVGVSLSEAEASVAAPFTSQIGNISCVLDVIREGRAALVTSFGSFKYIASYSIIQLISVSLLYIQLSTFGDFQFLFIDLFLILPIALFSMIILITRVYFLVGRSEPCHQIHHKAPTSSLVSKKVLLSLMGQCFLMVLTQVYIFLDIQNRSWYVYLPADPNGESNGESLSRFENTALFLFSNFQYITTAVVFSVGPPYRKPIYYNYVFIGNIILITVLCIYFVIIPDNLSASILQLAALPMSYRAFILTASFCNCVLCFVSEVYIFPWLLMILKFMFVKRKKLYKTII